MSTIDDLLHGSVDLHIHNGPDTHLSRSVDALDAAREADAAGMRAIVLKSHYYPTAPLATIVSRLVSQVTVVGSICLNPQVGGLNPAALDVSGGLGAKMVWLPTHSSAHQRGEEGKAGGLRLTDDNGKLLPVMHEILELVKKYDMLLATGHVSKGEVLAAVDEALKKGIRRIIITHPTKIYPGPKMDVGELRELAAKGAYIEHCGGGLMPGGFRIDPKEFIDIVRAVGPEHSVLSTDFGQDYNPKPAEGFRFMLGTLLKCGMTAKELEIMTKINPAKALALD